MNKLFNDVEYVEEITKQANFNLSTGEEQVMVSMIGIMRDYANFCSDNGIAKLESPCTGEVIEAHEFNRMIGIIGGLLSTRHWNISK